MATGSSVTFFDTQFRRQLQQGEMNLNPFERKALAYARGRTLDYGCGLGNFALAAAERGCNVLALDGRNELSERFAGWEILALAHEDFPAPHGAVKSFVTLVARKA